MAKLKEIIVDNFSYPLSASDYIKIDTNGKIDANAAEVYGTAYNGKYLVSLTYLRDYVDNAIADIVAPTGEVSGGYVTSDSIVVNDVTRKLTVKSAYVASTIFIDSNWNDLSEANRAKLSTMIGGWGFKTTDHVYYGDDETIYLNGNTFEVKTISGKLKAGANISLTPNNDDTVTVAVSGNLGKIYSADEISIHLDETDGNKFSVSAGWLSTSVPSGVISSVVNTYFKKAISVPLSTSQITNNSNYITTSNIEGLTKYGPDAVSISGNTAGTELGVKADWLSSSTGGFDAIYEVVKSVVSAADSSMTITPNNNAKKITFKSNATSTTGSNDGNTTYYAENTSLVFTTPANPGLYDAIPVRVNSAWLSALVKDILSTNIAIPTVDNNKSKVLKIKNTNGTYSYEWGLAGITTVGLDIVTTNGTAGQVVVVNSNGTGLTLSSATDNDTRYKGDTTSSILVGSDNTFTTNSINLLKVNTEWLTGGTTDKTGYNAISTAISGALTTANGLSATIFDIVSSIIKQGTGTVTVTPNTNKTITIGGGGSNAGGTTYLTAYYENDGTDNSITIVNTTDPKTLKVPSTWFTNKLSAGFSAVSTAVSGALTEPGTALTGVVTTVLKNYLSSLAGVKFLSSLLSGDSNITINAAKDGSNNWKVTFNVTGGSTSDGTSTSGTNTIGVKTDWLNEQVGSYLLDLKQAGGTAHTAGQVLKINSTNDGLIWAKDEFGTTGSSDGNTLYGGNNGILLSGGDGKTPYEDFGGNFYIDTDWLDTYIASKDHDHIYGQGTLSSIDITPVGNTESSTIDVNTTWLNQQIADNLSSTFGVVLMNNSSTSSLLVTKDVNGNISYSLGDSGASTINLSNISKSGATAGYVIKYDGTNIVWAEDLVGQPGESKTYGIISNGGLCSVLTYDLIDTTKETGANFGINTNWLDSYLNNKNISPDDKNSAYLYVNKGTLTGDNENTTSTDTHLVLSEGTGTAKSIRTKVKLVGSGATSVTAVKNNTTSATITFSSTDTKYALSANTGTSNGSTKLTLSGSDNSSNAITFTGGGSISITSTPNTVTVTGSDTTYTGGTHIDVVTTGNNPHAINCTLIGDSASSIKIENELIKINPAWLSGTGGQTSTTSGGYAAIYNTISSILNTAPVANNKYGLSSSTLSLIPKYKDGNSSNGIITGYNYGINAQGLSDVIGTDTNLSTAYDNGKFKISVCDTLSTAIAGWGFVRSINGQLLLSDPFYNADKSNLLYIIDDTYNTLSSIMHEGDGISLAWNMNGTNPAAGHVTISVNTATLVQAVPIYYGDGGGTVDDTLLVRSAVGNKDYKFSISGAANNVTKILYSTNGNVGWGVIPSTHMWVNGSHTVGSNSTSTDPYIVLAENTSTSHISQLSGMGGIEVKSHIVGTANSTSSIITFSGASFPDYKWFVNNGTTASNSTSQDISNPYIVMTVDGEGTTNFPKIQLSGNRGITISSQVVNSMVDRIYITGPDLSNYLTIDSKIGISTISASATDVPANSSKIIKATNTNGTIKIEWKNDDDLNTPTYLYAGTAAATTATDATNGNVYLVTVKDGNQTNKVRLSGVNVSLSSNAATSTVIISGMSDTTYTGGRLNRIETGNRIDSTLSGDDYITRISGGDNGGASWVLLKVGSNKQTIRTVGINEQDTILSTRWITTNSSNSIDYNYQRNSNGTVTGLNYSVNTTWLNNHLDGKNYLTSHLTGQLWVTSSNTYSSTTTTPIKATSDSSDPYIFLTEYDGSKYNKRTNSIQIKGSSNVTVKAKNDIITISGPDLSNYLTHATLMSGEILINTASTSLTNSSATKDNNKFILFKLGGELHGTPIRLSGNNINIINTNGNGLNTLAFSGTADTTYNNGRLNRIETGNKIDSTLSGDGYITMISGGDDGEAGLIYIKPGSNGQVLRSVSLDDQNTMMSSRWITTNNSNSINYNTQRNGIGTITGLNYSVNTTWLNTQIGNYLTDNPFQDTNTTYGLSTADGGNANHGKLVLYEIDGSNHNDINISGANIRVGTATNQINITGYLYDIGLSTYMSSGFKEGSMTFPVNNPYISIMQHNGDQWSYDGLGKVCFSGVGGVDIVAQDLTHINVSINSSWIQSSVVAQAFTLSESESALTSLNRRGSKGVPGFQTWEDIEPNVPYDMAGNTFTTECPQFYLSTYPQNNKPELLIHPVWFGLNLRLHIYLTENAINAFTYKTQKVSALVDNDVRRSYTYYYDFNINSTWILNTTSSWFKTQTSGWVKDVYKNMSGRVGTYAIESNGTQLDNIYLNYNNGDILTGANITTTIPSSRTLVVTNLPPGRGLVARIYFSQAGVLVKFGNLNNTPVTVFTSLAATTYWIGFIRYGTSTESNVRQIECIGYRKVTGKQNYQTL